MAWTRFFGDCGRAAHVAVSPTFAPMKKILSIILAVFGVVSVFGQGFTFHNNGTNAIRVSWTVMVTRYAQTADEVGSYSANGIDYILYAGQTGGGWTEDHYYTGGSAHETANGTYTQTMGGTASGAIYADWFPYGTNTFIVELYFTAPPPPPPPPPSNTNNINQATNGAVFLMHFRRKDGSDATRLIKVRKK